MNAMEPKKMESQLGTPNTRISSPVAKPVTAAFVGNTILACSVKDVQGLEALFRMQWCLAERKSPFCACSVSVDMDGHVVGWV